MRIIAGTLGGRRLSTPKGRLTRPTSELVRGAIFNSLAAHGELTGATVVDLFAGSGALGIEALSRGSAHVTFVESDAGAKSIIDANIRQLGLETVATVLQTTVERWAQTARAPFDVVLADPPYGWDGWNDLLAALVMFPVAVVVAEAEREVSHDAWDVFGVRHHGDTVVSQLRQRRAG